MYNELIHFIEIRDKFDQRIQELHDESRGKQTELQESQAQYEKAIAEDAVGVNKISNREMSKYINNVDSIKKQIQELNERISIIESMKKKELLEQVPSVKAGRDREVKKGLDELYEKIPNLRKYKAEYLLFVAELHKTTKLIRDVDGVYKNTVRIVTDANREWLNLPTINLHSVHAGRDNALGILADEVNEAYRLGRLPAYVQWYKISGELLDERLAISKLQEFNAKEAQTNG